jgi:hypothetical protein
MAIYYCMSDILDLLEKSGAEGRARFSALIAVSASPPSCGGHPEDGFSLSSSPKLLDIENDLAAHDLALVLKEAPLYHINMQLALDDALSERHNNATVERALETAFAPETLPNMLTSGEKHQDEPAGSLRHPMLEHSDLATLCRYYMGFVRNLPPGHKDYNFERNILGKHPDRFMQSFDGFTGAGGGKVKAEILVGFGMRQDHDKGRAADSYEEAGIKNARRMAISDPRELLWAWLEADNHQMRRCRDIDRLLRLGGLPRLPNWVKADIHGFMEKEAMKLHFAQQMKAIDKNFSFIGDAFVLRKAVSDNAAGQRDELLLRLMQFVQGGGQDYDGVAGSFVTAAQMRAREIQKTRL